MDFTIGKGVWFSGFLSGFPPFSELNSIETVRGEFEEISSKAVEATVNSKEENS
jgi:hypothetical protein